MEYSDIILRLGVATLIGAAIGLNRDLHGKPTGVRTLGLVALGSALLVMASGDLGASTPHWDAASRVIQGIITGIGFLGAGVIIRRGAHQVKGFTTAASIWLTAGIGVACGLAAWRAVIVAVPLILVLLVFGGRLERALHATLGGKDTGEAELS
jgi:putative Mg2+ transporter-C (MgtC) family protein